MRHFAVAGGRRAAPGGLPRTRATTRPAGERAPPQAEAV